jgi:hydroxymethylbilane synthase
MIIGTRGSSLARVQAETVARLLAAKFGSEPTLQIIQTQGDKITDRPLRELEGRGYFTKEIEEALLSKAIDVAVHSFKDMPSKAPDGLAVAAVSVREDPADLLLVNRDFYDEAAGEIPVRYGAVVGTSAVRREAQLKAMRPDLESRDLRGNVPTRIRKLEEGHYDAIFLASAGVRRLKIDLSAFEVIRLEPTRFVPSPGQGALAIQMRGNDAQFAAVHEALHDETTGTATMIERDVQRLFGGGCSLPLGTYAYLSEGLWHVHGFWGGEGRAKWGEVTGDDPKVLGEQLFAKLSSGQGE